MQSETLKTELASTTLKSHSPKPDIMLAQIGPLRNMSKDKIEQYCSGFSRRSYNFIRIASPRLKRLGKLDNLNLELSICLGRRKCHE